MKQHDSRSTGRRGRWGQAGGGRRAPGHRPGVPDRPGALPAAHPDTGVVAGDEPLGVRGVALAGQRPALARLGDRHDAVGRDRDRAREQLRLGEVEPHRLRCDVQHPRTERARVRRGLGQQVEVPQQHESRRDVSRRLDAVGLRRAPVQGRRARAPWGRPRPPGPARPARRTREAGEPCPCTDSVQPADAPADLVGHERRAPRADTLMGDRPGAAAGDGNPRAGAAAAQPLALS